MSAAGKTFPAGHFTSHNEMVVADIKSKTDIKSAVKAYVDHAVADGIALVDAGASAAQMRSSLQALSDQFETAWAAMTANTSVK